MGVARSGTTLWDVWGDCCLSVSGARLRCFKCLGGGEEEHTPELSHG